MAELKKFGAAFEALRECACAVERGDLSRADFSMKRALDLAEDDNESLVRYFAKALAQRAYRLFPPKYPSVFSNCYQIEVFYSCRAAKLIGDIIGKADLSGKSRIHLIFFSLNCFSQETLSFMKERLEKVPQMCLKITLVDNSCTTTEEFFDEFDFLIHKYEGIKFEFNRVGVINQRLDELEVSRLKIDRDDEFVVVNCSFLLGYMLPAALNKFLLMLRDDISPDMFNLTEYDANLNQNEFLQRFDESLQHYSNLSTLIDRYRYCDSVQHLRDEISNVVACEGGARVVRHMTSDQWRDLLNKSGFSSIPVPYDEEIINGDYDDFDFIIENGCTKMNRKGQERPLFFFSAWKIKESSFVKEDIYHNSLDGDDNFRNLPISPDPQHRSLIRMASLAEIHDMTYRKLKDYEADYHVQEILVWGKCEDNHNDGRSSQLNPCLCIVDQIGFDSEVPKYHLQERNYVSKTFESNQACFVPHITDIEKYLPYQFELDIDWINGAFAIKLDSLFDNCEGYVVVFLFSFPYGMVSEKRTRRMEKILWELRNEKSSFVTCPIPDDFLDKLNATPDAECIIDNPSVQSQSHNNVMDSNVPLLQLLHGSSTLNAMPASHQKDLLDSLPAEWLNQNEVNHVQRAFFPPHRSSTPSTKTTNVQNVMPTRNKEGCIKRKGEPEAPSTSKRKPSPIWQHVHKETSEDGKKWVKCNYNCGFHREDDSRQGTKVWMNHLERLHNVKFKNVQESSKHPTPPTQMTGVETKIFKDVGFGSSTALSTPISGMKREKKVTWAEDLTEDVQTKKISSRRVVITNDEWIEGSKQWENALVGYVLGPKPTLEEMTSFAKTRWEKFQVPKVSLVDDNDGIFLFDFESIDMKRGVWESQWTYKDHLLVLRQMTPDLDLDTLKVSRKVPIWMELPKLHFSLWNPELLGKLAHVLGTLVDIDMSTKNRKQLTCARILVEVDIDTIDDLPSEIPIDLPLKSIDQPVVFDRKSVRNSFMASKIRLQKAGANEIKRPQLAWLEENVRDYLIFGFTLEEKNLLEQWRKYKAIGKIVTTLGTIDVADTSLARLVPPQENVATPYQDLHIDDTVIDAYFHLLKARCDDHPNKYRKHHFFSSFMAKKILDGNTKDLSKWYKAEDLADVCELFLPVHVQLPSELNHWVLLCVNIEDRKLLWMDSCEGLYESYGNERDTISKWFVGTLLPDMGYKEANCDVIVRDDIPKQETAFDCGVFVMKYADCLTQGDCFPFSQSDMVRFRERIFLDIFFRNVNANINI